MYVMIPEWIRNLNPESDCDAWLSKKSLLGQRNGTLRWFEYFEDRCETAGLSSYAGSPTIMKLVDGNGRIHLTIHVDDVLVVSTSKDFEWFKENVTKDLTIKVDGPHAQ